MRDLGQRCCMWRIEQVQALSYKAVLELSCSLHDFVEGLSMWAARLRGRVWGEYLQRISNTKATRMPRQNTPKNRNVRSEKSQNESSPNFSNFCPGFCPEFLSEISRFFFWGFFVLCFVGNGDQKKITKNPRYFSMQNSQANTEKKSQNVSGEEAR